MTKIFHPNVASNGEICVNTLKKDWKAELGIKHILLVRLIKETILLAGNMFIYSTQLHDVLTSSVAESVNFHNIIGK